MPILNCRFFNGYKPCGKSEVCDELCPSKSVIESRLLIVHLEALGAVLRTTSLLAAIKRKFPNSQITWVTQKPADQLLRNNPYIDRVLTTQPADLLALQALEFDAAFCLDKSLTASGVLQNTKFDLFYGFRADPTTGAIVPATPAAEELWSLGLNNAKKFFENQKPETQLAHEALELGPYLRDSYVLQLTSQERLEVERRRDLWALPHQTVIGINTGCSTVIPYKKLSIVMHRKLITRLKDHYGRAIRIVLLGGGEEDNLRNQRIGYGLDVIQSETVSGLRDGLVSVAACDLVISGDSLGMHMAIALKKWVIAWFGATCSQEIDLFDRGMKVHAKIGCRPCWKRHCSKEQNGETMCYDLVSVEELIEGVHLGIADLHPENQPSLPRLLEA